MTFRNRHEAGRLLGEHLAPLRQEQPVVLALPRGGVPVAAEVARALGAPLDVIVVRKLGVPFQPEVGFGAIGEGGVRLFDADLIRRAGITEREVAEVEARERAELDRRVRRYRGDRPPLPIAGRTVVIVDDGLATGGSARAAVQVARAQGARRIVLAVPVAPPETVVQLQDEADQVVSLVTPPRFVAVGLWYDDFEQTSDDEVAALLRDGGGVECPDAAGRATEREVVIRLDGAALQGHLDVPAGAEGIVLFAHGSGSSRHSPRNQAMARAFHTAGLATLLFDLLAPEESGDRRNVFDIELLGSRLLAATEWVRAQPDSTALGRGYFGASTGGGQHCGRPVLRATTSVPWCLGVVVPTSPARGLPSSVARPCSSSAAPIGRCLTSIGWPPPNCGAATVWRWCRGRPTSSRNRVRSRAWPSWPSSGSGSTCRRCSPVGLPVGPRGARIRRYRQPTGHRWPAPWPGPRSHGPRRPPARRSAG